MQRIKSAVIGISLLFACLALTATGYAGMMGGGRSGPNGHRGGYNNCREYYGSEGYHGYHGYGGNSAHHGDGAYHGGDHNGHHDGSSDYQEPAWDQDRGNRSMDAPLDGAGENAGPYRGNGTDSAPADSGQHHQGP